MELTGTLDTFPLRELLELMQDSSICGLLHIEGSRGSGVIGANDGLICHAEYADQLGHEALWLLFEEPAAHFTVRADKHMVVPQTLIGDARMLSDEGEDRAKQWRDIRPRVPSPQFVPIINGAINPAILQDSLDRTVFNAIDGSRTVAELVAPTGLELLDVSRSLARLVHAGMISLKSVPIAPTQPALLPPPANESAARPIVESTGGLFRRPLNVAASAESPPTTGLLARLSRAQQRS